MVTPLTSTCPVLKNPSSSFPDPKKALNWSSPSVCCRANNRGSEISPGTSISPAAPILKENIDEAYSSTPVVV